MRVESGAFSVAFAPALSPAPIGPFPPLPSELDVRISRIQLSSGIMHLAHGTPVRSCTRGTGGVSCPRLPEAARLHPQRSSPTRRQACSRPDGAEPPIRRSGPFAYACDGSELPAPSRGVHRQSHSRGPSPRRHHSSPEAPFLDGRYPASPVLRASPPPCRPGLPLARFRLPRARHRRGFPYCHASIFHACRRHYPGESQPVLVSLASRPAGGLPLSYAGSAFAMTVSGPVQAYQRDPLGAAARQAEWLQRLLASLQMVDQRDRRWSGALRCMRVPVPAVGPRLCGRDQVLVKASLPVGIGQAPSAASSRVRGQLSRSQIGHHRQAPTSAPKGPPSQAGPREVHGGF